MNSTQKDPTLMYGQNAHVTLQDPVSDDATGRNVALYLRVSTEDQDLAGQERDLRRYVATRGWIVTRVYAEKISGTGKVQRELWEELRKDAKLRSRRGFDRVVVWALDRWSRDQKFTAAIGSIEELESLGVKFHSMREPILDSGDDGAPNMARDMMRAVLPVIASFEARRHAERTRVAMREIKEGRRPTRSGRPPGRPRRMTDEVAERIRTLRYVDKLPWKTIAQYVHMPAGSCSKVPRNAPSRNPVSGNGQISPMSLPPLQPPPSEKPPTEQTAP
jgi:DNA invertase Pin-like site-specific DNA recombinase